MLDRAAENPRKICKNVLNESVNRKKKIIKTWLFNKMVYHLTKHAEKYANNALFVFEPDLNE